MFNYFEYSKVINVTSTIINTYSMEFDWLLGLSYYLRANSFISIDNADKAKNDLKKVAIEPIEFAEDISIPELPNLPDVPLTEEDK